MDGVYQVWRGTTYLDTARGRSAAEAIDAVTTRHALDARRDLYRVIRLPGRPMRRAGSEADLDYDRENPRSYADDIEGW